jgi:hypothetical protein
MSHSLAAPWALAALTWVCAGCATTEGAAQPPADPAREAVDISRVFTNRIASMNVFLKYADEVAGERFVKAVVDVKSGGITYFDVNLFPLHSDFVFKHIYQKELDPDGLARFVANYGEKKPEFLLPYVTYHVAQDIWTLSFYEGDRVVPEDVDRVYGIVRKTFFAGDKLKFRPDNSSQEEVARSVTVPVITNDAIYRQSSYQAFTPGQAYGVLRIIKQVGNPTELVFSPEQIVVLADSIPQISVVSGVVSESFTTPLSHVSLRARAWGVPHVGVRNASILHASLDGKVVFLDARQDGYELRLATAEEAQAWKKARERSQEVHIPSADLEESRLLGLVEMGADRVNAYGAKAANLGEIARRRLPGFIVPEGFGIPIRYYRDHVVKHGVQAQIEALLNDGSLVTEVAARRDRLEAIRQAIKAAPIDSELLDRVMAGVVKFGDRGVFCRSSTNAEDLPGFNGAGLYDTVPNAKGREAIGAGIKHVWASVWNVRAYEERTFYSIDHRSVYGAVLVQLGAPARSAGVLITANMFDPRDTQTYTINAKSGLGIRVVEGTKIPEQILFNWARQSIKVLSRSDEDTLLVFDPSGGVKEVPNPQKGQAVLTDSRVRTLVAAAKQVAEIFPKHVQDVEWLFGPEEELYIVQSRPYVTRR